jgi:hypothetical protein
MVYAGLMRYPDGGGLSAQGRAKREAVRMRAAEWFTQRVPVAEIASRLRVSTNAVYGVWRASHLPDGGPNKVRSGMRMGNAGTA